MWKPMIDGDVVRERITEEIGPVGDWTAITEGENSQAYSAVADGRAVIVRVNLRREGFELDAWAANVLPEQGISVPEVLTVGAVGGIDPATGNGRNRSWSEAVAWGVPKSWPELSEPAERAFLEGLSAATLADVEALPDFDRLVHGDYSADNLIVAEDGAIGVIDWECAMIGDPLWDLAYQLFWSRAWPVMAPQARASATADFTPSELNRLRCYMTVAGLRSASFYLAGTRGPELALMIDRLRAMPTEPASIRDLLPAH
jgi:hygromycin-B 4-O-kinase